MRDGIDDRNDRQMEMEIDMTEKAFAATKKALLASGFSLAQSGEEWLVEWWNGEGRGGPRPDILASERGEAELAGLCEKIERNAAVLREMAETEYRESEGGEEGLSGLVLKHFAAFLSELSLTPLCNG